MITPKETGRKKVNFMVDNEVMIHIVQWVPAGQRSDFVNHALQEAVQDLARQKAIEAMDRVRMEGHFIMSDKEIRKAREYGRE